MILLDTSALVASLVGPKSSAPQLRQFVNSGERIAIPSLVLYEWLRGPRSQEELLVQEQLVSRDAALPFGVAEADLAAQLYRNVRRARSRQVDIAIAATAIANEAALWTLNHRDFADIPGLRLL